MAKNFKETVRNKTIGDLVSERIAGLEAQVPLSTAWQRDLTPIVEFAIESYAQVRQELVRRMAVPNIKANRELLRKIKGEGWR